MVASTRPSIRVLNIMILTFISIVEETNRSEGGAKRARDRPTQSALGFSWHESSVFQFSALKLPRRPGQGGGGRPLLREMPPTMRKMKPVSAMPRLTITKERRDDLGEQKPILGQRDCKNELCLLTLNPH